MVKLCPGFALIARDIFSLYVDDGCPRFAPRSKPVESNCSSEPPVNLRRLSAGDARAACLAEGARVCDKHSYELTKSQVLQSPLIRLSDLSEKIVDPVLEFAKDKKASGKYFRSCLATMDSNKTLLSPQLPGTTE